MALVSWRLGGKPFSVHRWYSGRDELPDCDTRAGRAGEAEIGETILAAARARACPIPTAAARAIAAPARACSIPGEIEMSPYSDYALSKPEREQGLILACRAVPWSDCEVAWLEADDVAMHPIRQLDCEVIGVEFATHDIRIVRLAIRAAGRSISRPASIASVIFVRDRLPPRDFSMANRPGARRARIPHPPDDGRRGDTVRHRAAASPASACASSVRTATRSIARAIAARSWRWPAARASRRSRARSRRRWRKAPSSRSISISACAPSAISISWTHFRALAARHAEPDIRAGAVGARRADRAAHRLPLARRSARLRRSSTASRPISPGRRSWSTPARTC